MRHSYNSCCGIVCPHCPLPRCSTLQEPMNATQTSWLQVNQEHESSRRMLHHVVTRSLCAEHGWRTWTATRAAESTTSPACGSICTAAASCSSVCCPGRKHHFVRAPRHRRAHAQRSHCAERHTQRLVTAWLFGCSVVCAVLHRQPVHAWVALRRHRWPLSEVGWRR
jgi:hypothetical protein